jgi:hypothetical protein
MIHKTYIVIPVDDITEAMIQESCHTAYTFRKSLDGSQAILKFCMSYPNTMAGYHKYSHSEILAYLELNKGDWEMVI